MPATKVSILINNYNYASYMREAIDSALAQDYSEVEVIVVDDGSVDDSHEVIRSYDDRIIPIIKQNGGQASAMNVGFDACNGDVVIFLDSDDVLLPDIVTKVVMAYDSKPNISKVQFRLRVVDSAAVPTGGVLPPYRIKMPSGNLVDLIASNRSYAHPPTSGNAFKRESIETLMPIPVNECRKGSAAYLVYNIPLFGDVVSLDDIGGLYRMHDDNMSEEVVHNDYDKFMELISGDIYIRNKQVQLFKELKNRKIPELGWGDLSYIKNRVIFKLLYPEKYIFADGMFTLCMKGFVAAFKYPYAKLRDRPLWAAWFVAMFVLPKKFSVELVNQVKNENSRSALLAFIVGNRNRRN